MENENKKREIIAGNCSNPCQSTELFLYSFLIRNRKKCKSKLYDVHQPIAEILRQINATSTLGAEIAMAKPKDQKHKEMVTAKKALFKRARGLSFNK